ncbi:MAG: glycosyltransferase [Prevotellaceae bacterium]|nr:glycosyltransferase [Prevotellaceae bacterium]
MATSLKILHVCLSGQYIDGWGYQENLLPHYLSKQGTENIVITSANHFPSYLPARKIEEIKAKGVDYLFDGVRIIRIPTKNPTDSLTFAPSLYKTICDVAPDVIFHHDVVFSTLETVRHYAKEHSVILFVDNHADELNMSHNAIWRYVYHKIANRFACHRILPFVKTFYGVSPGRCNFLKKYYSIPSDKISLLPIGADDELAEQIPSKDELRKKYGFNMKDRIVVSGGKMGKDKGTDVLISVTEIIPCKLVLFGSFSDDETKEKANQSPHTRFFGWCDRVRTLELLRLADVACWPIHHTTLIEDAVSVETPLLVRQTGNTIHLVDGNGNWINLNSLQSDLKSFFSMDSASLAIAAKKKKEEIAYSAIAHKIITDID